MERYVAHLALFYTGQSSVTTVAERTLNLLGVRLACAAFRATPQVLPSVRLACAPYNASDCMVGRDHALL